MKGAARVSRRDPDAHLLGQVLLATLLGILVIIFTVSSITVIPVIYWAVAGLGVGYVRMTQGVVHASPETVLSAQRVAHRRHHAALDERFARSRRAPT